MKIFYIKIPDFLDRYGKNPLSNYALKDIPNEKRYIEHCVAYYLVKDAGFKIFDIENTQIIKENNKPKFKYSDLNFSISHSKDYVFAVFDNDNCAIDIQFMKNINLSLMSKRYNKNFYTKEEFYEFWTQYEAEIKFAHDKFVKKTIVFDTNYMLRYL